MPNLDLVARFFGVDAGAGAQFDRIAGKSAAAGASLASLAKYSTLALGVVAVGSIKAAADYQKLTENLVTGAGESQRNLKMVSSGMLSMAGQVGDSASTLAKAMFTVESAGYHGAAGLNLLKIAAEGAKVDNADLTTVVDALTSAMNAYHIPAAQAAKTTNTLIASAAVGKMHLQDLAGALGTVLPSAAALRVPLDQVGAAMATMTMQGTNANRAATYLRFSFAALANPTSKAQAAMQAVGLTSAQVANTMTHGGLPAVFSLLEDAVGRKFPAGSAQYLAALANMVGGTRGLQAVLELTGKNLVTMQANLTSIDGRVRAAGNSVSDWSKVQKNFNQQLAEFADGLQADAIRLGQDLLPAATSLLHVLTDTGHAIGDVTGFFEHNRLAAIALGSVLSAVLVPKIVETAIWLGRVIAINAGAAFIALSGSVIAAAEAFAGADGAVAGFGAAMTALDFSPVGLALAGIGLALGAVTFGLLSSSDAAKKAREAVDTYVSSLKTDYDVQSSVVTTEAALTARINQRTIAINKMNAAQLFALTGRVAFSRADQNDTLSQFNARLIAARKEALGLDPTLKELGSQLTQVRANAATASRTTNELSLTLHASRPAILTAANALGLDLSKGYAAVAPKIQAYIRNAELSHHPTQEAAAAFKDLGNKANDVTTDIGLLDTAWSNLVGNFIGMKVAKAQAVDSLVQLSQALKKSGGSLGDNTAAGRAAVEQLGSTTSALNTFADSVYKQTGSYAKTKSAMQSMVNGLVAELPKGSKVAAVVTADISKYLAHLAAKAATAGRRTSNDYVDGIRAGLESGKAKIAPVAASVGAEIDKNVRQTLLISSPSKKAIRTGQWYAQGLALGLDSSGHEIYVSATQAAHQLALGLTEGFKGESLKVKDSLTQSMQSVLSTISAQIAAALTKQRSLLKTDQQKLVSDLKAQKQAIASAQSSIAGNADVSNVLGQSLTVGAQTISYTANIGSYLGQQASLLKREANMFGRLRKMGLSPHLLTQISALAPSDAITVMQQILSGSDGSIRSLNNLEGSILSSSKRIATGAVNTPHELNLIKGDRREIRQQTELLHKIEQHLLHFRENPTQTAAIHLSLHELGFTAHEIRKIMAGIRKAERAGVKL